MTRNRSKPSIAIAATACAAVSLAGCSSLRTPENLVGAGYQPAAAVAGAVAGGRCLAPAAAAMLPPPPSTPALLAPGDRLVLAVAGDKDVLSGAYTVGADGALAVGDEVRVAVAGRSLAEARAALRRALVAAGLVRDLVGNVGLTVSESAGVPVFVEGAVFAPGMIRAGERSAEARATTLANPAAGDDNNARTLSVALRAAGGVRPDAALGSVTLVRAGIPYRVDARGALMGGGFVDPPLAAGDRVVVASAGCFQPDLVRPSAVTAPGIRVYMSNLSRPATHNAGSAIGKESTSLPYGTRLLQGLVSANCVGGSMLNAGRQAVLISKNPVTGQSVVIARSVEALVREAHRDAINPYLMPDDAIACYDSRAMALVDALGIVGDVTTRAILARGLVQ